MKRYIALIDKLLALYLAHQEERRAFTLGIITTLRLFHIIGPKLHRMLLDYYGLDVDNNHTIATRYFE